MIITIICGIMQKKEIKGKRNLKIDDKELEKVFLDISQDRTNGIEELYSKYNKIVYSIAFTISKSKADSEDIMQIVFTKIYEIEDSKLPTKSYASWLYSITKNETINFLKKSRKDISLSEIYEISDNNNELKKVVDNIEFNRLISKLKEKEKEIISLKILSNFSFEEIGNLLNEPIGTVKWRYYKAIYSLKAILGNLAMFIVSLIIGVKVLVSSKENENISQTDRTMEVTTKENDTNNSSISEGNILQDESKSFNSESTKEENFQGNTNNIITNIMQDNNNTIQENTIYSEKPENYYNQYIGYGFLGISIIFLLLTLYFLLKHQLKHLKKLSK